MTVMLAPTADPNEPVTTLNVVYAGGDEVTEQDASWLRGLLAGERRALAELEAVERALNAAGGRAAGLTLPLGDRVGVLAGERDVLVQKLDGARTRIGAAHSTLTNAGAPFNGSLVERIGWVAEARSVAMRTAGDELEAIVRAWAPADGVGSLVSPVVAWAFGQTPERHLARLATAWVVEATSAVKLADTIREQLGERANGGAGADV